ncbi:hypothetical protein BC936DRAFT_147923 [Jimgerdemannia flammicorona]|uniref:polynucleotide adenylyltransferase n=1 Tax=Jimgerdemannia flammicorona TaxID=994334 RepID=A0A433D467_9FUNG|nr:hypothetical protein BC936DRAFT_147923 [Jimgerdemannia flammicorona]
MEANTTTISTTITTTTTTQTTTITTTNNNVSNLINHTNLINSTNPINFADPANFISSTNTTNTENTTYTTRTTGTTDTPNLPNPPNTNFIRVGFTGSTSTTGPTSPTNLLNITAPLDEPNNLQVNQDLPSNGNDDDLSSGDGDAEESMSQPRELHSMEPLPDFNTLSKEIFELDETVKASEETLRRHNHSCATGLDIGDASDLDIFVVAPASSTSEVELPFVELRALGEDQRIHYPPVASSVAAGDDEANSKKTNEKDEGEEEAKSDEVSISILSSDSIVPGEEQHQEENYSPNDIHNMKNVAKVLKAAGMAKVVAICTSNVPVCKCFDPITHITCDLTTRGSLGIENTRLIRTYCDLDERVRPFLRAIKLWAKRRHINDYAKERTLSSFMYVLLGLYYLQTREPPVLPNLQILAQEKAERRTAYFWHSRQRGECDVTFAENVQIVMPAISGKRSRGTNYNGVDGTIIDWECHNTENLGSLVYGFFETFAHKFDWAQCIVSVRTGGVLEKNGSDSWRSPISIQDPFVEWINLARWSPEKQAGWVWAEIARAERMLRSGTRWEVVCKQLEARSELKSKKSNSEKNKRRRIKMKAKRQILNELQAALENGTLIRVERTPSAIVEDSDIITPMGSELQAPNNLDHVMEEIGAHDTVATRKEVVVEYQHLPVDKTEFNLDHVMEEIGAHNTVATPEEVVVEYQHLTVDKTELEKEDLAQVERGHSTISNITTPILASQAPSNLDEVVREANAHNIVAPSEGIVTGDQHSLVNETQLEDEETAETEDSANFKDNGDLERSETALEGQYQKTEVAENLSSEMSEVVLEGQYQDTKSKRKRVAQGNLSAIFASAATAVGNRMILWRKVGQERAHAALPKEETAMPIQSNVAVDALEAETRNSAEDSTTVKKNDKVFAVALKGWRQDEEGKSKKVARGNLKSASAAAAVGNRVISRVAAKIKSARTLEAATTAIEETSRVHKREVAINERKANMQMARMYVCLCALVILMLFLGTWLRVMAMKGCNLGGDVSRAVRE